MVRILTKVDTEVKKKFQKAQNIFFFVGSGVSVSSGVPSFQGLEQMDYFEGFFPMYLSSQEGFNKHPKICWRFFQHIYNVVSKAEPNVAHKTIYSLQLAAKKSGKNITILTLAYDGLLSKSGVENVLELHGNINYSICSACKKKQDTRQIILEGELPICSCGGLLRPNIVLLDESVEEQIYDQATIAVRSADMYFVIGSSGVHQHSKYFLTKTSKESTTVEINPISSYLSRLCDFTLRGNAEDILPQLQS